MHNIYILCLLREGPTKREGPTAREGPTTRDGQIMHNFGHKQTSHGSPRADIK